MINLEKQKRIGIKQAKVTIANIYKQKKPNDKGKLVLTSEQQAEIARQQAIIDRWQRANGKSWKL